MRIPGVEDREEWANQIIEACFVSRNERTAFYDRMRSYYMFGSDGSFQPATYNKIFSTVDLSTAFLFASETTKFSIHLAQSVPKVEYDKVPTLSQCVNDIWQESHSDMTFGQALTWSHVYGTTLVKLIWNKGVHSYMLNPHDFGVYREDLSSTDQQEAVVHKYKISHTELDTMLRSHPNRVDILNRVSNTSAQDDAGMPTGLMRLVISSSQPTMMGNIDARPNYYEMRPQVAADMVDMFELYVFDDETNDYRMLTIAAPGVIIYDRPSFFIPGELPFVKITPDPIEGYYWGMSMVDKMTGLQDWRSHRVNQVRKLLDKQYDPPLALSGFSGIPEEKLMALRRAGGLVANQNPAAKVENLRPQMPTDTFSEMREIDDMFDELVGLSNTMRGKGESGVRSMGHADLLAKMSSSRVKKKALIVEDSLEKIATLCLRLYQRHSDDKLTYESRDENGNVKSLTFIAEQFTRDYTVKVDAHSSSPIFIEDQKEEAMALLQVGAIDREAVLDIFNPPGVQTLKTKLRIREKQEAAQKAAEAQAEQAAPRKDTSPVKAVK